MSLMPEAYEKEALARIAHHPDFEQFKGWITRRADTYLRNAGVLLVGKEPNAALASANAAKWQELYDLLMECRAAAAKDRLERS